eukprot:scaffold103006_cov66-Phaeocystis_antarctica.AAC.2
MPPMVPADMHTWHKIASCVCASKRPRPLPLVADGAASLAVWPSAAAGLSARKTSEIASHARLNCIRSPARTYSSSSERDRQIHTSVIGGGRATAGRRAIALSSAENGVPPLPPQTRSSGLPASYTSKSKPRP